MSEKKLISEIGLTTDKTSRKAELYANKGKKLCIEVSWDGASGTLDSTFDLKYSLTTAAETTSNAADQIILSTASGTELFFIDPHEVSYLEAVFVINTCSGLNLYVTSSMKLGGEV